MVKATKIFVEKLKCTLIAKLKLDEDMTFRGWIIWRLLDACISWHAYTLLIYLIIFIIIS